MIKCQRCQGKKLVTAEGEAKDVFDKITEASLLYDFYGRFLTEKQQEIMRLYHEENLSLSEIGEAFSISRQGVYDALKTGEKVLFEYEEKLGLVRRLGETERIVREARNLLGALLAESGDGGRMREDLCKLGKLIDQLSG